MKRLLACLVLSASLSASAQDDCELFNIQEIAAENLELQNTILDTAIVQTDGSVQVQLSNGNAFQLILGCTDSDYTEYSVSANTDDGSCATAVVSGCTDANFIEYDASANTDDGSCATLIVNGCTDPAYTEYDASANTDDGSCVTAVVSGCTDANFIEYDASANTDNGSCATLIVNGCTSSAYTEYNASANTDDGSCATLIVNGCTDPAYVEYSASASTDDGSCVTLVVEGCTDAADANYDPAANTDDCSCANSCCSIEFDDYTYSLVEIGDQCWFAENLRTTVYADDSSIPEVTDNLAWEGLSTGARCDYNNDASNVATYGRLYNWYAADNASGLCPSGWHVPTDGEWTALEDYITAQGFYGNEGTALRSTFGWDSGDNGTDDFGFSALPGGIRFFYNGNFNDVGLFGYWWSSSPNGGNAWFRSLDTYYSDIYRNYNKPRSGFSVRCLRDAD